MTVFGLFATHMPLFPLLEAPPRPFSEFRHMRDMINLSLLLHLTLQLAGFYRLLKLERTSLQAALIENQQLLRVLCHDIKSPLISASRSLRSYVTSQNSTDVRLSRVNRGHVSIHELIDNIMILNSLGLDPNLNSSFEEIPLDTLVRKAVGIFDSHMIDKELRLTWNELESRAYRVKLHPDTVVHQVLSNLLSTAVKFCTRKGTITLRSWIDGSDLFLSIENEGVGLPQGFDLHAPVLRRGTEGEHSYGVGLRIARQYAIWNQLDVHLENVNNPDNAAGTRATIRFKHWRLNPVEKPGSSKEAVAD